MMGTRTSRRLQTCWLGFVLVGSSLVFCPPAAAQGDVESLLTEGFDRYREGDLDAAKEAFEKALSQTPSNDVIFNWLQKTTVSQLFRMARHDDPEISGIAVELLKGARKHRRAVTGDAEAVRSAAVTHDHPEGIKGAQATALAVFLARSGEGKDAIRRDVAALFDYDLDRTLDDVRDGYAFDVSCQGSVPESILAFLESMSFEDAVKLLLVSFDSTIKANLSVGLPLDLQVYAKDSFVVGDERRIEADSDYYQQISSGWGDALRQAFQSLPDFKF